MNAAIIVMMMFFELFYLEKCLSSQARLESNGVTRRGQWGHVPPAACFLGRHFDILFHRMTQIAHNHGKCWGKVGKNIKMS